MNTVLFIIDPQNDFCNPKGSLFVPGAVADIDRIVGMIDNYGQSIDEVVLTADDHLPNDISHPTFWRDKVGEPPRPFSQISYQDYEEGKFVPAAPEDAKVVESYIQQLEEAGKAHTIWPEHCISGTWGAEIDSKLLEKLIEWTRRSNRHYQIIRKGWYPYSEHFGAFEAEVPYPMEESTLFNTPLARKLDKFSRILLAGEAKSHCVCHTVAQMINKAPELVAKTTILTDAMSTIQGYETLSDVTFEKAKRLGASFATTVEVFNGH